MPNNNSKKRKAEENDCDNAATKKSKTVCVFCLSSEQDEIQFGEFLTKDDLPCHYFCLLLASGLYQNANPKEKSSIRGFLLNDIRNEVRRGYRLKCNYCHGKGATLGCCAKKCKKTFHLPCGRANGTLHKFFGGFGSYCDEHCPKQHLKDIDINLEEASCNICLSPIDENLSSVNVLHSPCCKNSWFHRNCLQQYAISAGVHHFRCPLCNCHKLFLDEMQNFGIYIPDQDASWERQSGAFDELLERHNTCDAEDCSCPQGRNHDAESGKFNLLLCSCCGAFGSHSACKGLVWYESSLMCPFCASIEKEFVEPERKARLKNTAASDSGICRSSNSQHEAGSSSSMQENVVHIEMADDGELVDIDGDIHVPPFLRNCSSKRALRQAISLPSCSIILQKIDEIIPLPQNFVNVTKIPGFHYFRRKGYLIRKKGKIQQKMNEINTEVYEENEKIPENVPKTNCKIQEVGKKNTFVKQFDGENDPIEQKIISNIKVCTAKYGKYKKTKHNKTFRSRRLRSSKVNSNLHTSPLSAVKKQVALKFLMKFNRNAQKRRKYQRKNVFPNKTVVDSTSPPQSGSEKKLVQSTLNFFKLSPPTNNLLTLNCKGENKTENTSIASSPHKQAIKADKENKHDNSVITTPHNEKENMSIATTPHKRVVKESKNDISITTTSRKKQLQLDEKKKDNIVGTPDKREVEDFGKEMVNTSIATTPHKRAVKADIETKDDISNTTTSRKKQLQQDEKKKDNTVGIPDKREVEEDEKAKENTSIVTTPHNRAVKADIETQDDISNTTTPCKKQLQVDEKKKDNTFGTPNKREIEEDDKAKENTSIATTPHKRAVKADKESKDDICNTTTPSKKRLTEDEHKDKLPAATSTPCKRKLNVD